MVILFRSLILNLNFMIKELLEKAVLSSKDHDCGFWKANVNDFKEEGSYYIIDTKMKRI